MHLHNFMFVSVLLMISEGFIVKGPAAHLVVPLGVSAILTCFVDKSLPIEGLMVVWIRADSNSLVHVFQDGVSVPEAQYQDYRDRAHFFTDQIQHGNFSLLLNNVTAEDKGFYRCKVYNEHDSSETLVEIKSVERLIVSGSDHSISAYVGYDVTLNCSVDSHITPEEIEELSWKKTDTYQDILVLLFQKSRIITHSSHEQYRDRVEFFTDEISKGNFSLRLKSVRTEDQGIYRCHVEAGNFSGNTTVELAQLGFSALHGMVLMLCIAASGSALLMSVLWYLQHYRSQNTNKALFLQMLVVCVPNLIMFFAFLFWGVIEGFLNETVACCAHYFLRPLLLLWAAPHSEHFPGERKTTMHCIVHLQYSLFANVIYSVLFRAFWQKSVNYAEFDRVLITVLFGIMILISIINIVFLLAELIRNKDGRMRAVLDFVSDIGHDVLPPLQLIFLFYAFKAASHALFVVGVFPLFLTLTRYNWNNACEKKLECLKSVSRIAWLIFMIVVNVIMVYSHLMALEKEKDCAGWACVAAFLQVLWGIVVLKHSFDELDLPYRPVVYLFGSVVVVLVNSVALMAELILKTVNGERAVGDLRNIVFPSECLFASSVLLLVILEPFIKYNQQCCQNSAESNQASRSHQNHCSQDNAAASDESPSTGSHQNQSSVELHELRPLLRTQNQESGRSEETEGTDSLVAQTSAALTGNTSD
ncbi:uncharacterized protein LOC127648295 isoform X2 [Xyrauchen texanus]|uniref:uncharacterized protein LOC127648295 isoform X2 n=1 Tax=Xyrauchen texanus TaxID=154827 RepID=UPI002242415F|nr:uncharacterized protein LOC127648295 isoform X2 [Xyrauchen texanus]